MRVYKLSMVSTWMKVPMAVKPYGAVRIVPMAVEAMEGWMNIPMAIETYGAVDPNETGMKVSMAIQAM